MHGRAHGTVLAAILAGLAPAAPAPAEDWRTGGFDTPESVAWDAANGRLIVSNIVGDAGAADGNGYLSLVGLDGRVMVEKWATGLSGPKGVAVANGRVYAVDVDGVHVFDAATGTAIETLKLEGAAFPNDAAAGPDGIVWITDMMGNGIWRIEGGKAEFWLQSAELSNPNGILALGDRLVIGAWGKGIRPDFTTESPGGLLTVDLATKAIAPVAGAGSFGNIDGVVEAGGSLYATDYLAGKVWRVAPGTAPEVVATLAVGAADLGTDGRQLFVPMMQQGEIVALPTAP